MRKTLLLTQIVGLFLFASCSTVQKKKSKRPKSYSQSVEEEFSSIENDQREILDHYRKLRQKNWDTYTDPAKSKGRYRNYPPIETRSRPPVPKKTTQPKKKISTKPAPSRQELPQTKIEEFQIEMQQYMNYYCMKNRGSSRFSNEADCSAYTSNILNDCESKNPVIFDRSIVNCVKRKLD